MLASPLSSTFMPDQPMVIIPQHTMPSSAPDSFYYGNGFNLGMHGARTGFSSFGNPNMPAGSVMPGAIGGISPLAPNAFFPSSASSFGSPSVLQSPLSAHAFHPSAFPPSSNDMSVDETTPTSPSSSNSNDLEEYVLAPHPTEPSPPPFLSILFAQKWIHTPRSRHPSDMTIFLHLCALSLATILSTPRAPRTSHINQLFSTACFGVRYDLEARIRRFSLLCAVDDPRDQFCHSSPFLPRGPSERSLHLNNAHP